MKLRHVGDGGFARIVIVFGFVAACSLPGRAAAADPTAPPQPKPERGQVHRGFHGLGSAEHPIQLAGTETHTVVLGSPGPANLIVLRVGRWQLALLGIPLGVFGSDGRRGMRPDPARSVESNVYSGGSVELAVARSPSFYIDGGRMILRDPLDVVGRDGARRDYWASAAGLAFRF